MNNNIIIYLRNNLLVNIFIIFIGIIFYIYIPEINIITIIERLKELTANNDTSSAIIKLLTEKNKELNFFITFLKLAITIILLIVMFLLSFFYHTQQRFQDDINSLKEESKKNINDLSSKIVGIESILTQHFDDYKIFTEYSSLQDSIIHHDFHQALKYDIEKIDNLKENEFYKSTVILEENYLNAVNEIELLSQYINILIKKAKENVKIQRIYILKRKLSNEEFNHLKFLKKNKIDIRLISSENLNKIKEPIGLSKNLSNNFIIINNKEVAFAYPFEDKFRFAVNIINNGNDREAMRYFNLYLDFFEKIYNQSNNFEGKT